MENKNNLTSVIISALKDWNMFPNAYIGAESKDIPCQNAFEILDYCGVAVDALVNFINSRIRRYQNNGK